MNIFIESRRKKIENVEKAHPHSIIIDVTSNSGSEYHKLSPFYPVGGIPVPGMKDKEAVCVEAVWQGLKVFENYDYDITYFGRSTKNIKRTVRKFGKVKGHYFEGELLYYVEARKKIYLPAYRFVLENNLKKLVSQLREIAKKKNLVLLDYTTNGNINDGRKPLSHAAIVRAAIMEDYSILETEVQQKKYEQGRLF